MSIDRLGRVHSRRAIPCHVVIMIVVITCTCALVQLVHSAKVLDLGAQLPELIEKHPEKSWLVKFYAPWCYHCQQLEPTFNDLAEHIYHRHDHLIVGRVDCTKHSHICHDYSVESYPTILHIKANLRTKYRGDRSERSMVQFADRLEGPSVNRVADCRVLKERLDKQHDLIVLSNINSATNHQQLAIQKEFESLADSYKSQYWLYHIDHRTCKDLVIPCEGIHLLKRHLNRALTFNSSEPNSAQLRQSIMAWIARESWPVFGQISRADIEPALVRANETLALALLDGRSHPQKKFTSASGKLYLLMGELARDYAQLDDELLFGWTPDVDSVEYISLSSARVPSVLVVRPDFTFRLVSAGSDLGRPEQELPASLSKESIKQVLDKLKAGQLDFSGGQSYMHSIFRSFFSNYQKFVRMYKANPLLFTLLFGFPSAIVAFVIYTTCFYEGPTNQGYGSADDDYDEEKYDDDDNNNNNHDEDDLEEASRSKKSPDKKHQKQD